MPAQIFRNVTSREVRGIQVKSVCPATAFFFSVLPVLLFFLLSLSCPASAQNLQTKTVFQKPVLVPLFSNNAFKEK